MTDLLLGKQWQIRQGDVREVLAGIDDQSVHCVITSPPYWGLRDYGLPSLLWGGSDDCEHEWANELPGHHPGQVEQTKWKTAEAAGKGQTAASGQFCRLCGCWRGSLGLEPTPELFIEHLVGIFREVKRVLRDDGQLWLNIAGCYWSDTLSRKDPVESMWGNRPASNLSDGRDSIPRDNRRGGLGKCPPGLKPKDWVPIPWMLGIALQRDGWWLRSPIIWAKGLSFCETYSGSVMPESVRDRPTTSYEYLLLLTRSKSYFYDQDAVRERQVDPESIKVDKYGTMGEHNRFSSKEGNRSVRFGTKWSPKKRAYNPAGRNLRSVWTINPRGFAEAHFATFPPKLVEPCIKAGTSERGCCPECGAPHQRVVEKNRVVPEAQSAKVASLDVLGTPMYRGGSHQDGLPYTGESRTLGWRPGCSHGHDPIPCLVLDPFVGSGTTVMVALRLGRRALGIDLSESYVRMAQKRIIDDNPMFNMPGEMTE